MPRRRRCSRLTDLLEYLSRHGIHAELRLVETLDAYVPTVLLACANHIGATSLVMGGYSHGRLGEFVFGGVTRDLLKNRRSRCSLPASLCTKNATHGHTEFAEVKTREPSVEENAIEYPCRSPNHGDFDLRPDGWPQTTIVGFANDGLTCLFPHFPIQPEIRQHPARRTRFDCCGRGTEQHARRQGGVCRRAGSGSCGARGAEQGLAAAS